MSRALILIRCFSIIEKTLVAGEVAGKCVGGVDGATVIVWDRSFRVIMRRVLGSIGRVDARSTLVNLLQRGSTALTNRRCSSVGRSSRHISRRSSQSMCATEEMRLGCARS